MRRLRGIVYVLALIPLRAAHADLSAQAIAMNCLNCHASGQAAASRLPDIGRLSAAELEQALLAFKYDRRAATLMPRLAKAYSDAELAAVAAYLARH
ncbi:c-type cytochrome [Methylomonas koyamae]|uniref:c-type cytochrome n=1 Tax=Methylomonas koyamae TaxID=702114 RepID=UPI0028731EBB|nr:c-type cytochrome [Methylomonas koyamae]WNB77158.1 c-type cytochrome [Methylomonas koyamae]